jgi:hypothetical protein
VHVLLRANEWRVVGARGGVGGFADRLRRALVRGLDGLEGQRRAVLAGVVLGEDEGLSDDVRDAFRASGLYHLLAVSGQNVALLAGGVGLFAWLLPTVAARDGDARPVSRSPHTCSRSAGSPRSCARVWRERLPRSPG